MTLHTLRWLLYAHKKEFLLCTSADKIKSLVWEHTKPFVTNLKSFKRGQRLTKYDALYEWIEGQKGQLTV